MCVGITSHVLRAALSVFYTGAGSNLVRSSFLLSDWRDRTRPMQNMPLKSASDNLLEVIGKIMLFVQLDDLHMSVHFGVLDKLPVL